MSVENHNLENSEKNERLSYIREQVSCCRVIFDNGDQDTQNTNMANFTRSINAHLALCINLSSCKIYIGKNHYPMFSKYNIPVESYLAGIYIITPGHKVHVEKLLDWSPEHGREIEDNEIKNIVASRIQNFITGQETLEL